MKTIKLLALFLMLAMLFVSCGDDTSTDVEKNSDILDPNAPTFSEELDLSGDFNILVAGYKVNDFEGDPDTATTVEYANYRRNEILREAYGVNITTEEHLKYGSTNGTGTGFQKLYTDYMSGNSNYDAASIGTGDVANLAQNGILWDLSSLPNIDLTKSYWDQKANEDLAVGGKMFYTTGEIGTVDNVYTHALIFNKDLVKSYNLENPYDLVNNNQWTLEKFGEIVKQIGQDVDNNGVYDGNDMYGALIWNDPMVAMLAGAGEKVASVNEDGEIELTLYSERVVNLYDTLANIVFDQQHVHNYQYDNATGKATNISTWDTTRYNMFNENRALFYFGALSLVEQHRDSELDFGILPYPKLDALQEDYGHVVSGFHTQFFCIPRSANAVRSSAVAELLAYYGQEYLTPAYYEKTLCGKYVRDAESTEMLDIIFASHVFDVGVYYDIGGYFDEIGKIFETRSSISTIYETYRPLAESQIAEINESFEKNSDAVYVGGEEAVETTEAIVVDTTPYSDATVVYLSNEGKGNGSSATSAVSTMTEALDCLDLSKDCTVVICDNYVLDKTFVYTDTFEGTVTITSNYDGVDYRENGAEITTAAVRFVCSGEYIFRDINFSLIGDFFYIVANFNPITIDTGVTMESMSEKFTGAGFATAFSIAGGYQSGQPIVVDGEVPAATSELTPNITVRSGDKICIGAYTRGIAEASFTGTATINICGDANVTKLYLCPVNGSFASGQTVVNVTDNATVGSITANVDSGVADSFVINWISGTITSFATTVSEKVDFTVTNGTTLAYSEAVKADANFETVKAAFDNVIAYVANEAE